MPKNQFVLIANNIITIAAHVCISLICLFFIVSVWEFGIWYENMDLEEVILTLSALVIYISIFLGSYFWTGKKLLIKVNNMPSAIFSVIGLIIVHILTMLLVFGGFWGWGAILILPVYPIADTISYFFKIGDKYAFLLLLLFLFSFLFISSLTILAGMMSKQHRLYWKKRVNIPNEFSLITNNIIAAVVHTFICFILLAPVYYLLDGDIFFEAWKWGLDYILFDCFVIVLLTAVAFYLYFWAGRKLLKSTQNMITNSFSTAVLVILILGATIIAYGSFGEIILRMSLFPVVETLSYLLQIDEKYIYMILSPLPSLTMLAGMMTKQYKIKKMLTAHD